MVTEDYCSFETAKLLKEKGFDSEEVGCHGGFYSESCYASGYGVKTNSGQEVGIVYDDLRNCDLDYDEYLRPTLAMAMKWLREEHKVFIYVEPFITTSGLQGYKPYCTKIGGEFMWINPLRKYSNTSSDTYEEAVEVALKYSLENLI